MNERDLIATQTIKQVSEGGDAVRADLKATSSALDVLATSSNNLGAASESSARRQTSVAAAFNAMARALDPASRAFEQLEKNYATFGRALDQNSSMLDKAGQSLDVYKAKLESAAVAAEALRRQTANAMTDPSAITGSVKGAPISLNQITGSTLSGVNTKDYAAQFEAAAKAQDDQVASIARLRAAINPLEVEQGKLGAETAQYREYLKQGVITQDEFNSHQEMTSKRLGDFAQNLKVAGTAGRVMSGEMTNLGFQLNDVVTGLALGQSPFMILGQQGGQIVQIFANSKASIADFAKSSMSWFTGLFTVGRAVFGGIAAAVGTAVYANASYISSQREVTQSLIGIGAKTQTTGAQINDFAQKNATATGLSIDQTRALGVELTKTGNISVAGIKGVGDAIHGFSILTGESVADTSKAFAKAFSGDVVSGAEELNKTYGFLDATTRDYIRTLELQGNRSAAIQVVIDAIAKDNIRAAESTSLLTKAYDALANAASAAKNAIGAGSAPQSNEDQLAALEKRKATLENPPEKTFLQSVRSVTNPANMISNILPPGLDSVNKALDELRGKIAGIKADNVVKQLDAMSLAGDNVVRSIIPQVAQIEQLQQALQRLNDAKMTPGVKPGATAGPQQDAAAVAIQNQLALLRESEAQAQRYNERVAEISQSWGNVGQSTALSLQAAQNQLPVAQAVGGAAKMAAQYTADYKNAMDAGKTSTEATAIAASNLKTAQAQVNSAAQETLAAMRDQAPVAAAVTGSQRIAAQAQATYNGLLRQGVDASTAAAIAAQQEANARAAASAAVYEQVHALEQSTELMIAQANGNEANVKAAQAYENAIRSGASAMAANALSAATLENELTKAAIAADKLAMSQYDQANGTTNGAWDPSKHQPQSEFDPIVMPKGPLKFEVSKDRSGFYQNSNLGVNSRTDLGTSLANLEILAQMMTHSATDLANSTLNKGGSVDSAIATLQKGDAGDGYSKVTDVLGGLQTLYGLKNSGADNATKMTNDQQFLSWLQGQPQTIDNLKAISTLTDEIKSLAQSTDSLNSTNSELLSPYYTQDPRTSHIGYRSQGMASGGSFIVPGGYSANDNVLMTMPLASGEEVNVSRPAQKDKGSNSVVINMPMTFNGPVNRDAFGRTAYQNAQAAVRQLKAVH